MQTQHAARGLVGNALRHDCVDRGKDLRRRFAGRRGRTRRRGTTPNDHQCGRSHALPPIRQKTHSPLPRPVREIEKQVRSGLVFGVAPIANALQRMSAGCETLFARSSSRGARTRSHPRAHNVLASARCEAPDAGAFCEAIPSLTARPVFTPIVPFRYPSRATHGSERPGTRAWGAFGGTDAHRAETLAADLPAAVFASTLVSGQLICGASDGPQRSHAFAEDPCSRSS